MAMLSQTIRNLKFMKNKKPEHEKVEDKTFSYYACKNIISAFSNAKKDHKKGDAPLGVSAWSSYR